MTTMYTIRGAAGCAFCQRLADHDYVSCDRGVVRFEPLNPVTPGHLLFIHRIHSRDAARAPWLTALVCEEAAVHGRSMGKAFNLITSVGAVATQTVGHLHVHYVPRRENDGLHLPWTNQARP